MAPKKKGQKLALVDFFAETPSSTSWADEMDTLPSAPTKKDPSAPRAGSYLDSMPDRSARPEYSGPPREEIPIPNAPPFTAFVGNLTFEAEEGEIKDFFGPGATSVRLVKDPSGKLKGFGYVEFAAQQDLKDALGKNMTNMGGRTIRVSVAESQSSKRDFAPSAAESASEWRRSGPLPAREAPQPRRAGSFADGGAAGPGAEPARDLDWGKARGAKFAPGQGQGQGSPSGDFRGEGPGAGPRDRESTQFGSGLADGANQWRSNKPAAVAVERPSPRVGSGQSSPGLPGLAETEQTWTRGSKLRTPVETPPVASPSGEEEKRDWRGSRAPSATASATDDSPKAPAAPLERRKLNLAPRSQNTTTEAAPSASKPSSSIFGAAKPIDTSSREAEVEAKRQEERKKAQEERARKHKEEEDKIKAEADARTKAISDAREAVRLEGLGPGAGAGAGAGKKNPPPRTGAGARQNSNSNSNGPAAQRPNKGGRTNSNQAQKTDDGFEVARGSRRDRENRDDQTQAQAQAQAKKDAPVRKGFSFAAAAGLVDDAGNGVQETESKGDAETEDVSKRLAEVQV